MASTLENASPTVVSPLAPREIDAADLDPDTRDPFDSREVFDLIRNINDPEHPLTLEELSVVELDKVAVDDENAKV